MKKILMITPSINIGGTEKIVFEIIKNLQDSYAFSIGYSYGDPNVSLKDFHIPRFRLPNPINPLGKIKLLVRLFQIIQSDKPDIVHTHHRLFSFLIGMIRLLNRNFTHIHTMHTVFTDKKMLTTLIKPQLTIAVGNEVFNSLINFFGYPPHKCQLLKNGVFIPENPKQVPAKIKNISCIGRLSEEKGQSYLLRAIHHIKKNYENHPEFRVSFIGDGPDMGLLKKEAQNFGINHLVEFKGAQTDIDSILNTTDLLVSSSLWEGLPLAPLEALAYCVPVIATDIKGNNEIIEDNKTGLLVNTKDPAALGDAVIFAIKNPDHMNDLAQNGYKRVQSQFTLEQMIKNYKQVYCKITESKLL